MTDEETVRAYIEGAVNAQAPNPSRMDAFIAFSRLTAELARKDAALREVCGCFDAAFAEGLADRLAEHDASKPGSLADLTQRRIMFAHTAARAALGESEKEKNNG